MRRPPFYGWTLVIVLGTTTTISYGTTAYLFGVLVVPIEQELGWGRATLSGAYAAAQILAGLAGVPIGWLADRYGPRALMGAGSALGGGALILLSHVEQAWQFYLLWGGLLGVAMALTYYPISFTVVANWFNRKRGSAMALLTFLGGFASPIFIPLAGYLVPTLGWRGALVALGLVNLLIALPLHILLLRRHPEDVGLLPDGEAPSAAVEARPAVGIGAKEATRTLAFWSLTVGAALDQLGALVVWAHQIPFVIGRGFDPLLAASVGGAIGLLSLPGRYVINAVSDRFGAQPLLGACLLAQAVAVGLIVVSAEPAALYAYVLLYGLAFGTRSPLRASAMAEHFGRRAYGAITAVQGVPVAIASGFGPLAAGALYDRLGDYQLAFGLTAGAFALSGLLTLITPRPRTA